MDRIQVAKLAVENNALQLENIRLSMEVLKGNGREFMAQQPALLAELKAAQDEAAEAAKPADAPAAPATE